ncbi:hypothetical protein XENORESO_021491, partial [Xenotaenia resolanae]
LPTVCSVLFRQTNIIWVAFCAGTLVATKMDEAWRTEHTKKRDEKSPPSQVPLSFSGAKKVMVFSLEFLTSPGHVKAVLQVAWPYAVAEGEGNKKRTTISRKEANMSKALVRRNSSKQGLQNLMRLTAQRSIEDAEEVERERRRKARESLRRRNSGSTPENSSPESEAPEESNT